MTEKLFHHSSYSIRETFPGKLYFGCEMQHLKKKTKKYIFIEMYFFWCWLFCIDQCCCDYDIVSCCTLLLSHALHLSSALLWPVFREICEFVLIIPRHWLKTDRPVDQSQLAVTSLSSDWWRAGRGGGRWRRGTPVASDSAATDWVLRVFSVSSAGVESATVS